MLSSAAYGRIVRYAKRRGVAVKVVSALEFALNQDRLRVAPFDPWGIGIDLDGRAIYVSEAMRADLVVPSVIHELGHLLFGSYPQDDETEFFGFEYLMARRLKIVKQWMDFHCDYGLDDIDGSYTELAKAISPRKVLRKYALDFLASEFSF